MLLSPVELLGRQGGGVQAFVDVAIEGQHGLTRVGLREAALPVRVALDVQLGQGRAQAHECRDVLGGLGLQNLDQARGLIHEHRLGVRLDVQRRVVVQLLGGGKQQQHSGFP